MTSGLFGQIALVVWRESMEALLVVGILNAWLARHADHASARTGRRFLWTGVAAGLAVSALLAAAMLGFASLLEGDREDLLQIAVTGIAAALILQMVVWMHRHGGNLQKDLVHGAERAMSQRSWWGLLLLAALAVAREGSEAVVFLYGILASARGTSLFTCLVAMAAGFAAAGALYWLLQLGSRRFSWRLFFRVTEILLLFLAASLLMTALDRAIGIDLVPPLSRPLWDTSRLLDDMAGPGGFISAMTGYRARPVLASALVYALYWLTAGALLFLPGHRRTVASVP
ncbi:FTR1 family iron permease [Mesorhizobium sp. 2RAF21]|jgi:high-affinity iron transporter|uniref:FTR1 family iron permease n=1 Tax=Mesorhizobium sp. 2RAF21 TaxID=3232995 RepID=UPI003F977FD4